MATVAARQHVSRRVGPQAEAVRFIPYAPTLHSGIQSMKKDWVSFRVLWSRWPLTWVSRLAQPGAACGPCHASRDRNDGSGSVARHSGWKVGHFGHR
jgi:hypothetical protein